VNGKSVNKARREYHTFHIKCSTISVAESEGKITTQNAKLPN
jgi:hypothetical protein